MLMLVLVLVLVLVLENPVISFTSTSTSTASLSTSTGICPDFLRNYVSCDFGKLTSSLQWMVQLAAPQGITW